MEGVVFEQIRGCHLIRVGHRFVDRLVDNENPAAKRDGGEEVFGSVAVKEVVIGFLGMRDDAAYGWVRDHVFPEVVGVLLVEGALGDKVELAVEDHGAAQVLRSDEPVHEVVIDGRVFGEKRLEKTPGVRERLEFEHLVAAARFFVFQACMLEKRGRLLGHAEVVAEARAAAHDKQHGDHDDRQQGERATDDRHALARECSIAIAHRLPPWSPKPRIS